MTQYCQCGRPALFRAFRNGAAAELVCVKHAGEIRKQQGVRLALVDAPPPADPEALPGRAHDLPPPLPGPPIEDPSIPRDLTALERVALATLAAESAENLGQEPLTQRELAELRCFLSWWRNRVPSRV
ncbi:MAG TPA: hypothetical protein VNO55_31695 [Polyangia bacterium]|nr:hypothetical protein [Polyangia bacterium]